MLAGRRRNPLSLRGRVVAMRRSLFAFALVALLLGGCIRNPLDSGGPLGLPGPATYAGAWADLETARIRPGVQVLTPVGESAAACTSNFLFRSSDNATLYLGLAAHCFGEDPANASPVGTKVDIVATDGTIIARAGEIAYNGWAHDPAPRNDFGLVALRNDFGVRPHVHPAVLHFGGPTGLQSASAITPGTHVITYGHSPQRAPDDPENPREGYVLQHENGRTTVVTQYPGIQGDSGSGLMTVDGAALGVLSMGTTNPTDGTVPNRDFPSINYYVDLDQALEAAKAAEPTLAGIEIVTAPVLEPAQLPL